ncbi:hypothetical protein [Verrucomicrobium spinosum]|uniref:hypothetical protein n=2 Tax=Verrucomicrobium spinosum TaxID=2736 RepID=UPI00017446C4|nr:hypothetical protein [Verrucomicrobium spinosum]
MRFIRSITMPTRCLSFWTVACLLITGCRGVAMGEEIKDVAGWKVHVQPELMERHPVETAKALSLLKLQLTEIDRKLPAPVVERLRDVPLWFSVGYAGVVPRAEYHPNAAWLKNNGREVAMAKGIEFSNILKFEEEMDRMPNFALHELAHAYHDLVLGFDQPEILAAFERAKAAGLYDRVEMRPGKERPRIVRKAYALTDHKEFFAECSEAYWSRNDFYPYDRPELEKYDPETARLMGKWWGGVK